MASFERLVINYNSSADDFKAMCDLSPLGVAAAQNLANFLQGVSAGLMPSASIAAQVGLVKASGTIVQTSTGAANAQTCTICGVTFTALTSGHVSAEATWNRNNTVATSASNLAAAINEYVPFQGMVSALASAGTVTVTVYVPGKIGNGLVMANVNLANTTITSFSGGLDGTAYSISLP